MSVPETFRDLERWDAKGQIFRRISVITLELFDLERPNSARGEERISKESVTPVSQGGGAQALPILGVPFYLCKHPLKQNLTRQRALIIVLGGQSRPTALGRVPALPIFGVPFYLCVHPLSQNYQIRRDNTWGRGVYLGVSHGSHP